MSNFVIDNLTNENLIFMEDITLSYLTVDLDNLQGPQVQRLVRPVRSVRELFEDREAFDRLPQNAPAYEVASYLPVAEGTPGGLFYGITRIHSWIVGDEYMMTKGHFHARIDRAEFYWGLRGEGLLLLMDGNRNCRAEKVFPGSLHYIGGGIAHRMINTGDEIFSFGACWPSDAGHDYATIARDGFAVRVKKVNGQPRIVKTE